MDPSPLPRFLLTLLCLLCRLVANYATTINQYYINITYYGGYFTIVRHNSCNKARVSPGAAGTRPGHGPYGDAYGRSKNNPSLSALHQGDSRQRGPLQAGSSPPSVRSRTDPRRLHR